MKRIFALILAAMLSGGSAQAAVIEAGLTPLGGSDWRVDFRVTNDGSPAAITGFTVYFSEALFADLALVSSPAEWDSIVIAPDLLLQAPGFFDALLLDPSTPLLAGQSVDGFSVQFSFLGTGTPPMLPFQIVDASFETLFEDTTVPFANQVPAASPLMLVALGLGLMGVLVRRRASKGPLPPRPMQKRQSMGWSAGQK